MNEWCTLDDIDVEGKTVLLRVDFNMPLDRDTLKILDDTRIRRVLPTINDLIYRHAKIVILAHQGRQGSWDFTSLEQHAQVLQELLGKPVRFVDDIHGEKAQNAIKSLKPGEVLMLDNVRRLPYETEKKTPEEHAQTPFIRDLAPLADVFIKDAFAAAHRAQCSLIGFTPLLPSCAGRLMEQELKTLEKILQDPERPSIFMFGGAKFSDIIVTIERLLSNQTADKILLTGLPANAFLKAKGYNLGKENEEVLSKEGSSDIFDSIRDLLDRYGDYIVLPFDFAVEEDGERREISLGELPVDKPLFDIGENTIKEYKVILGDAKTVFLSGPCGVFEKPIFMRGTREIFTFVANSKAFSIVGGGHTVAAVKQLGLEDKISHISTGGGSLEKFMMGEKLPVIEALKQAKSLIAK
ncbi:MAG TPA: phosphoglycerate kinase [Thermoplasmatales archaeon]|nr:phosphoglycerate kinase [Thermoplasmatales archaeon]